MSIEVDIDTEHKIVSIRIIGHDIAMQEVADAYGSAIEDPRFEYNMDAVWDISGVNVTTYSIAEFRKLPALLGKYSSQRGSDYRVALVTNRRADLQLLRLYSAILRLIGSFRMRVFAQGDEGMAWLRATAKEEK
jgi:hypothetical protein